MNKRAAIVVGGAIVLGAGWALFRPELLFIDKSVNEALPAALTSKSLAGASASRTLAKGMFRGIAHETKGAAAIHEIDGKRILRLTGFETSNGPDVRVLLVAAADAPDDATVKNAGSIELGKLKGNVGDQNYDIPADVDLGTYRAVTIWCNRFSVNFGTAPLTKEGRPHADAPPMALRSGAFHGVAHDTKGTATVHELDGGQRILRLTGFETSNGPDLRVFLIAAADASDNDTVKNAAHVELGNLKGNIGDQNYDIPSDVDLGTYRAVTIWCNRFGVNFATAPLK
jgi:hypothetical protein